jgi:hypothetical protein
VVPLGCANRGLQLHGVDAGSLVGPGELDELGVVVDVGVAAGPDEVGLVGGEDFGLAVAVLALLPSGSFLVNAGHADDEIDTSALRDRESLVPYVESCRVGDTELYLVAGGAPVNITAGFGDTLDSFDVTLAVLVRGIGHMAGEGRRHRPACTTCRRVPGGRSPSGPQKGIAD